jgi:HEPN domain
MVEVVLHDDPARTTPIGLARYSCEFLEAALITDEKMGRRTGYEVIAPIPVMFLVRQSIELSLKAYLLQRGVSLTKLRTKLGHNLHKLLRKAKELDLKNLVELTEEELNTIEILNVLYTTKQLQYIVTGAKTFPVFGPLQTAAKKLVLAICTEVGFTPKHLTE